MATLVCRQEHDLEYLTRLPAPFHIFRYVWSSDDLHFGLFEAQDEPILEAVDRMAERVLAWVPDGSQYILDLGTGFGKTACRMAAAGHQVVGVAPSPALIEYAQNLAWRQDVADRTEFHAVGFEGTPRQVDPAFDVILSMESLQYLRDLEDSFQHFASLTGPKARVIISDQVLRHPEAFGDVQFHPTPSILECAEQAGFRMVHYEDLTARAAPCARRALAELRRRRDEVIHFFRDYRPDVEQEFEDLLRDGARECHYYDQDWIGYELFVFET